MRRTRLGVDCAELDSSLETVAALARMRLNAARHGSRIELVNAAPSLIELLNFAGLAEVLFAEGQRQAEQREDARGVEEEGDLGDAPAL